jgi:hypothetical protein
MSYMFLYNFSPLFVCVNGGKKLSLILNIFKLFNKYSDPMRLLAAESLGLLLTNPKLACVFI